jgi:hypothetical protein
MPHLFQEHLAAGHLRISAVLLLLLLTGCGNGSVGSANAVIEANLATYHAYGDSITAGVTLANPATQAYPTLVAQHQNVSFVDDGIGGDQSCDVPTRQIFANAESPTLTAARIYSLLIGTNDVDRFGTGAYEAIYIQCHQASIAW